MGMTMTMMMMLTTTTAIMTNNGARADSAGMVETVGTVIKGVKAGDREEVVAMALVAARMIEVAQDKMIPHKAEQLGHLAIL